MATHTHDHAHDHRPLPDYDGPTGDTIDIELYEHWLEPATE